MREAIYAAVAALVAAFLMVVVMSVALAEEAFSPEAAARPHPLIAPPISREPEIVFSPPAPIFLSREPEIVFNTPPEPEPEPESVDIRVADENVSDPPANTGMGSGNVEEWRPLVTAYFGEGLADTALCLVAAESGGAPGAQNPSSGAAGLFQIMPTVWADHFGVSPDALFDPETNVRIAKGVYDEQGWGAWSPFGRGECR